MRRIWTLALTVLASATIVGPAFASTPELERQAKDDRWGISSVWITSNPVPWAASDDEFWRVTFKVPHDARTVEGDYESQNRFGGFFANVNNGHAAVDIPTDRDMYGNFHTEVRLTTDSGEKWTTTLGSAPTSRSTQLTAIAGASSVAVGGRVSARGRLLAEGEPIAGHWVTLEDVRIWKEGNSTSTRVRFLGEAQTDRDGAWRTTVPVTESIRLGAAYCAHAEYCWGNPNSPAFAWATPDLVRATWAPTFSTPKTIVAKKRTPFSIKVPQAGIQRFTSVPVQIQALRGGTWKTIAKGKLKVSKGAVLRAKIGVTLPAGKSRVRVHVPKATIPWPGYITGSSHPFVTSIDSGTSSTKTVKAKKAKKAKK